MQSFDGSLVTFVRNDGVCIERNARWLTMNIVIQSAREAKARFIIRVDDARVDLPDMIGVFDMKTAQQNNPMPGQWSINDPIRHFEPDQWDGAVMWAIMQARKP